MSNLRNLTRAEKYQLARQYGLSSEEARRARSWGQERFSNFITDRQGVEKQAVEASFENRVSRARAIYQHKRSVETIPTRQKPTSNEAFKGFMGRVSSETPTQIDEQMQGFANEINKRFGYKHNRRFGFAVVYYMTVENMSYQNALSKMRTIADEYEKEFYRERYGEVVILD